FRALSKRILGNPEPTPAGQGKLFSEEEGKAVAAPAPAPDLFAEMYDYKTLADTPHDYRLVEGEADLADFVAELAGQPEVSFDTETTSLDARAAELVGLSFSWETGKASYLPCSADRTETLALLEQLRPVFEDSQKKWVGQNIKYDLIVLK